MFLNKLLVLQMLNILNIRAVINKNSITTGNYKTKQSGAIYLSKEQPLWILQNQKDEQEKLIYKEITPLNHRSRQLQQQLPADNRIFKRIYKTSKTKTPEKIQSYNKFNKGLQLPHNYIPFRMASKTNSVTSSRRYRNSKFMKNMPVFDAVPGDEAYTNSSPIFIYNGNKGRMILNTMLSERKYPMQEPVPGQVLYPPQTLVFKPKALVNKLQQQVNVTMIPFYAYEAIDPSAQNQLITTSSPLASASIKPGKNYKKAKQYAAFFSPQQVLSPHRYDIEHTTEFPLRLEKPYENHRLDNISTSSTTPLPHKKFEVTYNDGEDKFQITYEDDAPHLERPIDVQTTLPPLPYESYKFDKNYYAFPVYTMAKLLEKDGREEATRAVTDERQRIAKNIDTAFKEENESLLHNSNEDTWFILNSRYKGPLKANSHNLHSSKYIHSSPVKVQHDKDLLKLKSTNIININ